MKYSDKETPEVLDWSNHLLVLSKPAGMLTQPSPTCAHSLELFGKEWIRERFQKPGAVFLEATHRLDRAVSGVVLFARTQKGLSRLQRAFRERRVVKTYLALVEGTLEQKSGIFKDFLVHEAHAARIVKKGGKEATLNFHVLNVCEGYTQVLVTLITGRYHQIRVQFAARGYPIIGDHKYGSKMRCSAKGAIALHHYRLEVPDPISSEMLSWVAPCPFASLGSGGRADPSRISHVST